MKESYNQVSLFIRSLLFMLFLFIYTPFYFVICFLAWPLPVRYRFITIAAWTGTMVWFLKVVCQLKYEITGIENIPLDRHGVVLCKHQSTWETFLLPTLFDNATMIVKRELLWIPFFGWGLATIDPIAINRSKTSTAMEQVMTKGKAAIATNRWVILYPEGTRIAPGAPSKYRLGGARLAVKANCPVLPVAHNAGTFWPKGKFLIQPGTVKVVIGPIIETTELSADAIMKQAEAWIESKMKEIQPLA